MKTFNLSLILSFLLFNLASSVFSQEIDSLNQNKNKGIKLSLIVCDRSNLFQNIESLDGLSSVLSNYTINSNDCDSSGCKINLSHLVNRLRKIPETLYYEVVTIVDENGVVSKHYRDGNIKYKAQEPPIILKIDSTSKSVVLVYNMITKNDTQTNQVPFSFKNLKIDPQTGIVFDSVNRKEFNYISFEVVATQ